MTKGPLVEDCQFITPAYSADLERLRKMGLKIHIECHIYAKDYIVVTVADTEPQRIEMGCVNMSFSCRTCFYCPGCDKQVYKLYLVPGGHEFKCQKCHALRYFLTTINKHTPHGKLIYSMNRMDKLSKQREKMSTVMYQGKYTKKFESFLRQCARAGYTKAVEDAAILTTALKDFQSA